ncbi:MAG: hormogonium polysaccharide biosynthesis protein HpsA [Hassallia sp. WJT32-NPBG1]|jgi:type II secretory pathway pseudopilin PulG|nr:hormogonium polysaccharide biosynthesis protein HpsA [Hassallia sp. WJT32-NPBG1]
MSSKRQLVKAIKILSRRFSKFSKKYLTVINKSSNWLLRTLFITRRRRESANAGFVLPTVAMVALVVVLLTTAILLRSFDRSKNATNVRVNEVVLNAATPAIDRAKAKLNKLFQDPQLPRATPTDTALEGTLNGSINEYTFGDETQLQLTQGSDTIRTAWLYPVDTDNNGKFDSYTIYGVYFKNPPAIKGKFTRARNPLEARTPPMIGGNVGSDCGDTLGTSATLVGGTGWFNIAGKLKKSFFVYTATVPITSNKTGNYEAYKGNKGFSAIEYQQDRVQLPLVNNAVVYEDDIALAPGTNFNLNGRIFTNSNFITGGVNRAAVTLYQVSSIYSCFYEDDNAKIIIGGNLGAGGFTNTSDLGTSTTVDLFKGKKTSPARGLSVTANKSVAAVPTDIAYNSLAYVQRINFLVNAQMPQAATSDPQEVKDGIQKQKDKLGLASYTTEEEEELRRKQLELYFKRRTRRVPYGEVAFNGDAINTPTTYTTANVLQGSGDTLRPPDPWIYPNDPSDGTTATNYGKLALNVDGTKIKPAATEPTKLAKQLEGKEQSLGDRALIGNNLPEIWYKDGKPVGKNPEDTQPIKDKKWDNGDDDKNPRTRHTRIEQLADLGATERDQDWELSAAKVPANAQDPVGGLRVITGTGIYLPGTFTTTSPSGDFTNTTKADTKIWSDMMPVASQTATQATATSQKDADIEFAANTPYLRMRATAVYHYKSAGYNATNPTPIACVSSYYDPTNSNRAKNILGLPFDAAAGGSSHNGIVYGAPTKAVSDYQAVLNYQAQLKYPNGRLVNEPLKNALAKTSNRTLSEQSAIDTALCALQILDDTIGTPTVTVPHGAIKETAFLDARQIKAIHNDIGTAGVETFTNADGINGDGTGIFASVPAAADYNLPIEQRQPLEIRATVLDINLLRGKQIGSATPAQEYLLPNSGIIYATRDDALLDLSSNKPTTVSPTQNQQTQKLESPVDFKLDPTRRPNAIMLTNGDKIWREQNYRDAEKGLILASNLPVYIWKDFNRHTQFEFQDAGATVDLLADDWSNFYSRPANKRNVNFACRPNDTRLPNCTTGDEWRPASVLSDAITLLSNNFRLGFREEGDYDLNNNFGDATSTNTFKQNGFFNNAYVANAQWYDNNGYPKDLDAASNFQGSSYLNNFVTPVQRRGNFHEYLMEVCQKLPVSACGDNDWWVTLPEGSNLGIKASDIISKTFDLSLHKAGTTAQSPTVTKYLRYPRRVAFKRDLSNKLVPSASKKPILLGINTTVQEYALDSSTQPPAVSNALWFQTTDNNKPVTTSSVKLKFASGDDNLPTSNPTYQPRLQAVLQINMPFGNTAAPVSSVDMGPPNTQPILPNWLQAATDTTFNLAAAGGDTPARPTEDNGGLHNFVRFLENWNPTGATSAATKARISGSFIQFKRSAYATGPFRAFLTTGARYPIAGNSGKAPFYIAPTRQWGYDVGLLSQSPDLFAQKLVKTPDDLPDEFFREVGRDDKWVKTLLCAKKTDASNTYALDADQRGSCS